MDINHSSLTRYKTSTDQPSHTASEVKSASASGNSKGTSDSATQLIKQLGLKEGQVVKGQIIDHRYNEVRIQISPGNQVVTAKVTSEVPLSIGQEASFQVTVGSSDQLVLKYLPKEASSAADTMIQKALTASGLSNTDNNRAIVQELLNHGMPIDKQTLQSLIKISYMNREASPLTLVLMLKNNLPMTAENIRQFEAYQNGAHQLLNNLKEITGMISELFSQSETSASNGILSNGINNLPQLKGDQTASLQSNGNPSALSEAAKQIGVSNMESELNDTASQLNSINIAQSSQSGNKVLPTDLNNPINQLLKINDQLMNILFYNAEDATNKSSMNPTDQSETAAASVQNAHTIQANVVTQDGSALLSDIMNTQDRTSLLNLLGDFTDHAEINNMIENKTATFKDILSFIQEKLPGLSEENAKKLIQSPEYTKLLDNAFLQKWTITPQKLSKHDAIAELYRNLQDDMAHLSQLLKSGRNDIEDLQLQGSVKKLQENIQFMKDLNEVYSYIQLPVQLRNKQLHSELYVFTRKRALKEKPDNISVLLHLDMDHLGPLNIHISLNHKTIQAKFYMEDSTAKQIIETNIVSLSMALSKKGYTLQSEVVNTYQKPDFSRDFIEEQIGDSDVKRYTFDIRT